MILEFIATINNWIAAGGFKVRLLIYLCSLAVGISLLQLVFGWLLKFVSRSANISHDLLKQTFRGIPTLLGILAAIYLVMEFMAIPPRPLLFMQKLFHSVLIMTFTLMVAHLGSGFLKHKLGKSSGNFASTSILATTVDLAVYIIGILILLESFGVSISPLITALGVGGLATALALQDTLANLLSGINILVSKQIKMGDYVRLASGEEGSVVDMNWRNTTIKTSTENMVVVPNTKIASSIITNFAQPFAECSISVPIGVSYDSDLDYVETVATETAQAVLAKAQGGVKEFVPYVRYSAFGENCISFNVVLRVNTVTDQHAVRHEFIKKMYARCKQEGIVLMGIKEDTKK